MDKPIIGLNFKLCIASLCRGEIKESDVRAIILDRLVFTLDEFSLLIDQYQQSIWSDFAPQAKAMALRLWSSNRIVPFGYLGINSVDISQGKWLELVPFNTTCLGEKTYPRKKIRQLSF